MTSPLAPWRAAIGLACLVLLPLAVWPPFDRPFATSKLWVAGLGVLALVAGPPPARARVPAALWWLAGLWMATFALAAAAGDLRSADATLLGILAPAFAIGIVRSGVGSERLVRAQTASATAVAIVALAQWAGADPFAWLGWQAPVEGASVRMRVYGTLGNPNFVGALMAMSVPLAGACALAASAPAWRAAAGSAIVLQAAALAATGSRGAVAGLAAGVLAWAAVRWSGRAVLALVAMLVFGGAAIAMSPARPLQTTIAGRVYLWQVVAPFATDELVTGHGPGAVAQRFRVWQRAATARGVEDPRFLGITDHAHNDYLEALVERGLAGLVATILPIASTLVLARRRPRPAPLLLAANFGAVIAGAVCALVDFPLARPTELIWWWTAIAQIHACESGGRQKAEGRRQKEEGRMQNEECRMQDADD